MHNTPYHTISRLSLFLGVVVWLWAMPAIGAEPTAPKTTPSLLTFKDFMTQVEEGHDGLKAAMASASGAAKRQGEGNLVYTPALFGSQTHTDDKKQTANPNFQGTETQTNSYTLGLSKTFGFGLQTKLSYTQTHVNLVGTNPRFVSTPEYYNQQTILDLSQPLWRNFGGGELEAQHDVLEGSALSSHYSNSFTAKNIRAQAETAYWQLTVAREAVAMQQENLARAQKILEWNTRRAGLHLADRADALQANAAVQLRQLDLQRAIDNARVTAKNFNAMRGLDSFDVPEKLEPLDPDLMDRLTAPQRVDYRDDVLAARETKKIAMANARSALEKSKPDVSAFYTYSQNGLNTDRAQAQKDGTSSKYPTITYGVRLSIPFGEAVDAQVREGYHQEISAAELNYQRKVFEQEQSWKDLSRQFAEAQIRLKLARSIELAQKEKLEYERDRLQRGRTTTSQVIFFEQDLTNAQLSRIQAQMDVISILANMKTFGDNQ